MKSKRRRSLLQICLLGAALFLPLLSKAQFTFTTNNGAITITGYTGPGGGVTIPSTTNGYAVTAIGNNAFLNKPNLTSVTIPASVTNIGMTAFKGCSGLTSVTIPGSVTRIGLGAFGYCPFLSTAYFQGDAPTVNGKAGSTDNTVFYGPGSFYVESGVVYYSPGANGWGATFGSWPTVCTGSNSPASAFSFITNNDDITITGYLGTNPDVVMPDTINGYPVTTIGNRAFYNKSVLRSVLLPNSVTVIENYAFQNCNQLLSVNLPDNLTRIGTNAFIDCLGITWVTIPNTVTNIGSAPFYLCYALLRISVASGNPKYSSLEGVLFDNTFSTLIQFPGAFSDSYTIPSSVSSIGTDAFFSSNPAGLKSVTIPDSVTNIGTYAFANCTSLNHAYFQGNAPSVNGGAGSADTTIFAGESGTAYYLAGTTGWGGTFGSWPTVLWNPQIQQSDGNFGVSGNAFGFNLTGTPNIPVVLEACTNFGGVWTPLFTGNVSNGSIYFSDQQWTNFPRRFYRVRSP